MIAAGVVTFEPDLERLYDNLHGISEQVEIVLIYDNGSESANDIEALAKGFSNARVFRGSRNIGIAGALNAVSAAALDEGASWIVTLDQDSICPPRMVSELQSAVSPGIAIATPYIVDRNKQAPSADEFSQMPAVERFRQAARRGAITSGSLVNLRVWAEVGGYDERFFIDYVDYDFNQRVMDAGYSIVRANRTQLLHEVGRAKPTWLRVPRKSMSGEWRFERFYSFGHSPFRCYYKARNRVLFTRKHGRSIGVTHEGVWQIPQQVLLTLMFEDQRLSKLKAFLAGVRDGYRTPLN